MLKGSLTTDWEAVFVCLPEHAEMIYQDGVDVYELVLPLAAQGSSRFLYHSLMNSPPLEGLIVLHTKRELDLCTRWPIANRVFGRSKQCIECRCTICQALLLISCSATMCVSVVCHSG